MKIILKPALGYAIDKTDFISIDITMKLMHGNMFIINTKFNKLKTYISVFIRMHSGK